MIDETDQKILRMLQHDGRVSNAEIARTVEMAPSAVLERIRKLEERGFISGYTARLDAHRLGYGVLAYVLVRTESGGWQHQTAEGLAALPQVQELHHIAGEDCFLAKVRCSDTAELGTLLKEKFASFGTIRSTRTTIVLDTVKETNEVEVRIPAKEG